ncbi:hypothetical protein Gotri_025739 [Gossypium trilobum]|uniref:Uncharacterized protein n=1 Tax=Gossypium trilobum TaxID=34281 RepID=A0A7J9FH01_9ROSI|nr:hypothetical protein [Gossypium trilobum]
MHLVAKYQKIWFLRLKVSLFFLCKFVLFQVCKVNTELCWLVAALPNVKWVLPDSYSGDPGDNSYGGEPFIDGKVVPYDDKYHSDWIQARNDDRSKGTTHPRKASRKQKKQ